MIINHMQCSICKRKADSGNWERGNPARWFTWTSPRIRINWWKHQRWIMSAMQWGIILSKHGLPANTQAYTHMVWGLDKAQRHYWDRLSLCFILSREEGAPTQISGLQSAFQTASTLRWWIRETNVELWCVQFYAPYLHKPFILSTNWTSSTVEDAVFSCKQTFGSMQHHSVNWLHTCRLKTCLLHTLHFTE